jgi:hypothetical protein
LPPGILATMRIADLLHFSRPPRAYS